MLGKAFSVCPSRAGLKYPVNMRVIAGVTSQRCVRSDAWRRRLDSMHHVFPITGAIPVVSGQVA